MGWPQTLSLEVALANDECFISPWVTGPTRKRALEKWNARPADFARLRGVG